jgi:undecaprenyl-diphosphatase
VVAPAPIGIVDAVVYGIVEGLTELLPVSSTGHLILLGSVLSQESEAHKALDIVIQLGAVVALVVLFHKRLYALLGGVLTGDAGERRLAAAVLVAFVPAAVVGLAIGKLVKAYLFGPVPVAAALLAGAVAMLLAERWRARRAAAEDGLEHLTPRRGLVIGLCQCLALWPGASRSMTTIVGAELCGLGLRTASEFSFLLAIPTLGAACLYDFWKNGRLILEMPGGAAALAVGLAVSFVVTLVVAALFLRFVARVGLVPFALYRIALSAVVLFVALR